MLLWTVLEQSPTYGEPLWLEIPVPQHCPLCLLDSLLRPSFFSYFDTEFVATNVLVRRYLWVIGVVKWTRCKYVHFETLLFRVSNGKQLYNLR